MEFHWSLFLWSGLNFVLMIAFISLIVWVGFKIRAFGKDIKEIKRRLDK